MNKLNNQELLELLKTDVKSFNVYREEYADQEIDFSNANLKGVNLQVRNSLKSANFVGAKLENNSRIYTYLNYCINEAKSVHDDIILKIIREI